MDEIGEDRSSSFSSGSPVLGGSTSESEKEDVAASGSGKTKGTGVPQTEGKEVAKTPPPKVSAHPPTPPSIDFVCCRECMTLASNHLSEGSGL